MSVCSVTHIRPGLLVTTGDSYRYLTWLKAKPTEQLPLYPASRLDYVRYRTEGSGIDVVVNPMQEKLEPGAVLAYCIADLLAGAFT